MAGARSAAAASTVMAHGAAIRVLGRLRLARGSSAPPSSSPARHGVASAHVPPASAPAVAAPRPALVSTEAVRPDDLSPAVRRLLFYQLDSAVKIEVFRHACVAARPWTIDALAAHLGLGDTEVAVATVGLCHAGVLVARGGQYERAPQSALLGAGLAVLERAYGTDAVQLLRAIDRLARGHAAA